MENKRYSELDWLRVTLILAVFLHHVFMPFNGDGWHIMNNESSKLLDDIMVYFEQIRLQVLFFIAGAGSYLLLNRVNYKTFVMSKFHRLFIPLMVGMIFIVPPQIYYEDIQHYSSILSAYQSLMFSFNNNHLWFIEFLIIFMLITIPFHAYLKSWTGENFVDAATKFTNQKYGLFFLIIPLLVMRLSLKLIWPEQNQKIENLSVSLFFLYFFFAGLIFIKSNVIWNNIRDRRRTNLKLLIASTVIFYLYYFKPDISDYVSLSMRWQLWWLVCTLVSWSALLTLVGYAISIGTKTPKWLKACNEYIYPFYILHQTVIVVLGFYIIQWQTSIFVKSASLLFSSLLLTCYLCFAVIRPFKPLRYLFGLKNDDRVDKPKQEYSQRSKPNLFQVKD